MTLCFCSIPRALLIQKAASFHLSKFIGDDTNLSDARYLPCSKRVQGVVGSFCSAFRLNPIISSCLMSIYSSNSMFGKGSLQAARLLARVLVAKWRAGLSKSPPSRSISLKSRPS